MQCSSSCWNISAVHPVSNSVIFWCCRCFRLSKQCQPSIPNRKRNPRKAPGSRTAHLEEKLDDLVSLIRSQASTTKGPDAHSVTIPTTRLDNGDSPAGPSMGSSTLPSSNPSPSITSTAVSASGGSQTCATDPRSGSINWDRDCMLQCPLFLKCSKRVFCPGIKH